MPPLHGVREFRPDAFDQGFKDRPKPSADGNTERTSDNRAQECTAESCGRTLPALPALFSLASVVGLVISHG